MATDDDLQIKVGLTEKQYLQALARMEASTLRSANKAEKGFARANRNIGRSFEQADRGARKFAGGGMRQASMQLSQIAQQGSATGDWVRALSIQLPDLALGLGTAGILVGALAGALIPMGVEMLSGADDAKELEKSLEGLEKAVARLEAAEKGLGASPLEMRDRYGDLAEDARRLFEIEREIAKIRAQAAADNVQRGIAESLGLGGIMDMSAGDLQDIQQSLERLREERDRLSDPSQMSDIELRFATDRIAEINEEIDALRDVSRNFDDLADILGITEEQAKQVAIRFAEIGDAQGEQAQAAAMLRLADYISEVSDNLADAEEEGQALYDQLLAAAQEMLTLAGIDIATGIGMGADEAARLADNLGISLANARALDSTQAIMDQFSRKYLQDANAPTHGRGSDPRLFMDGGILSGYESDADYKPVGTLIDELTPKGRGGKGGGGRTEQEKELNRLLSERDKILRDLETASEAYEREVADLDALMKMGELTSEQYNAALASLNEEFVRAEFSEIVNGIESVADALADAIVNGEDLGDALGNVFRQIASDLISSGLKSLFMSTFNLGGSLGGGGGLFGGIFGSLFGGGRAGGGSVLPGRLYRVNENTPNSELFMPSQPGRVLTPSQARAMGAGAGGGGPVKVELVVQAEEGAMFVPRVQAISADTSVAVTGAASQAQRNALGSQMQRQQDRGTTT